MGVELLKKEITAVHFDMDGVLVDSEPDHVKAEQQTCRDYGFDIDVSTWGGFKGQTAEAIFSHLIQKYGDPARYSVEELITYKTDVFIDNVQGSLQPIEGAIEFLEWAKSEYGVVKLVTSSNRRIQECVVRELGIGHLFDHILTGDDVMNGKPDPEPYLQACKLSGVKPENSIVIEDSVAGIQSGLTAGCGVLAIATSHGVEELQCGKPTIIAVDYNSARKQLEH